jgi:transposase
MAFLRKENKKGQTYLSICESYRDEGGNVQRRTLHNLGNADRYTPEALERMGRQLIELVKGPITAPKDIEELSRHNYGFPLVIYRLLCIYRLDTLMHRLTRNHKLGYSLLQHLLLMLCDRFNDPLSKLGSFNLQTDYIGLGEPIALQHLYRTLDHLAINNQLVQTHIYNQHSNLFTYELDVVFYDVTTFYFDSDEVVEGALRQKGFGKDGKIGKTQILFSLLIDKNKVPIGFQIFKGSQFEGHTFKDAINTLKKKYNIKRIIVVADSGMLNGDNIGLFEKDKEADGYEYIVGDRLKGLSEEAIAYLTNLKNYIAVKIEKEADQQQADNNEDIFLLYTTYIYKGRTIICTWSSKRAAKDKADREEKIKKAHKMLKTPSLIERKSKRYFIKSDNDKKYELDQEQIKWQAKFDGFKAIATNAADIKPEIALEKYKDLYKIEQSFRTFKSYLETRPMFHWTDKRIEGHLVLCYIAFCLLNYLQQKSNYSEQTIRTALSKMELSKIRQEKEITWLRSAMTPEADIILKTINLKQLPSAISQDVITHLIPSNL